MENKHSEILFENEFIKIELVQDDLHEPFLIAKSLLKSEQEDKYAKGFHNEFDILKSLDIAGVRKAKKLKQKDQYRLFLEYIPGKTLNKVLQEEKLSLERFLDIGIQLGSILQALHKESIIHKNINPSNVLIKEGSNEVYLIDFSIAAYANIQTDNFAEFTHIEGDPAYISPEQTGRMNHSIDIYSDFYSLGILFYRMLSGKVPFPYEDPMEIIHAHIARLATPIHEVKPDIPVSISRIIHKLLNKDFSARYQSAAGLIHDLKACKSSLQKGNSISDFLPGTKDYPTRFQIPEKLYGREKEIQSLLDAYSRISSGRSEILLVKGESGIGKSALIGELHKPTSSSKGNFIRGKFNEYQTNIPYEAFIQAFDNFTDQLLSRKEEVLQYWKQLIQDAVGERGKLLTDVIPKLEIVLGPQKELLELGAAEAQNRANQTTKAFVNALSKPEHPLVIFIDDLQWADAASLNVLRILLDNSDEQSLLIVGAYRDNEVDENHPLSLLLEDLKEAGGLVSEIQLKSLALKDIQSLLSDILHLSASETSDLAELLFDKTHGNPFFLKEFLKEVNKRGHFHFEPDKGKWEFDFEKIQKLGVTDNVLRFIAEKLDDLPAQTLEMLKLASASGTQFSTQFLEELFQIKQKEILEILKPAILDGLVMPEVYNYEARLSTQEGLQEGINFRFPHDRIREGFYSKISESELPQIHIKIANSLNKKLALSDQDNLLFEVANHYKLSTSLLTDPKEALEITRLFNKAGERAHEGAAYRNAINYFREGIALLPSKSWESQYALSLSLHQNACEAAYSVASEEEISEFGDPILNHAKDAIDRSRTYMIMILNLDSKSKVNEAMDMTIQALTDLGLPIKRKPGAAEVGVNLLKAKWKLRGIDSEYLLNLPPMTDKKAIAKMQIIYASYSISYRAGLPTFYALTVLKSIFLSLEHGNCPESAMAYCLYGVINVGGLSDFKTGLEFGDLSLKLEQKNKDRRYFPFLAAAYFTVIFHLREPAQEVEKHYKVSNQIAKETGNPFHAGSSYNSLMNHGFWYGQKLEKLFKLASQSDKETLENNQLVWAFWAQIFYQTSANLLGYENPEEAWLINGSYFNKEAGLKYFAETEEKTAAFAYHLAAMYLALIFDKQELSLRHAEQAIPLIPAVPGMYQYYVFLFYYCLALISKIPFGEGDKQSSKLRLFQKYKAKLKKISQFAPHNFRSNYTLLEAELARVRGQKSYALEKYHEAIDLMEEKAYENEKGITYECAGRFYLEIGNKHQAQHFYQMAFDNWWNWGARKKCESLLEEFPFLKTHKSVDHKAQTSSLDLKTLFKASTAISSEIIQENLLDTLMNILIENAGARKGIIFEKIDAEYKVLAIKDLDAENAEQLEKVDYPVSILNYVNRAEVELVLNSANSHETYSKDAYIMQYQTKSVLCFPIFRQEKVRTLIYLENRINSNVFTPARIELLRMLSSQIGISLENASLYENLEAKVAERTHEIVKQKEATEAALESLKSTQSKLVESEKMASLGQLTAGIAHEINNPINFVRANIDSLKLDIDDLKSILAAYHEVQGESVDEKLQQAQKLSKELDLNFLLKEIDKLIEDIKEGAIRTSDIVSGLRNFSRLDEDAFKFVDINKGIDSTLTLLNSQLRDKVKVHKDYADLELVECLPGKINQVLMNILTNSIQAIPEKGDIFIKTEQKKEKLYISIKDTGTGMSNEVRNKIFEPFFTTKDVGEGTGLGLSISYGIIERHGGEITVNSTPSVGTEFIVSLPIKQLSQDHG